ncbi:MaoC family dehydratase N-terminal domain-containing protein [Paraburkholderia sediminicola]|uniref:FAS1-like dehydratase domain-containing protein n=1 Tax=Paraburkholderia TaxID=1822464 RepID=UPI0038BB9405
MSEPETYLTAEVRSYIGMETQPVPAFDPVERGAVRRFAQAIMDADPVFMDADAQPRYGGPVAPPLFPLTQHRLPFGVPDVVSQHASDPDYDGTRNEIALARTSDADARPTSLPPLPLDSLALLNGGSEIELYRYMRHGETLYSTSRYADIFERRTSKGLMVFVVTTTDYLDEQSNLVARVKLTTIRR